MAATSSKQNAGSGGYEEAASFFRASKMFVRNQCRWLQARRIRRDSPWPRSHIRQNVSIGCVLLPRSGERGYDNLPSN